MPWCPKCLEEYDAGITTCADCGSALVDKLESELERKPVLIYHASSENEAKVVIATLEAEGIVAFTGSPNFVLPQESFAVNDDVDDMDIFVLEDKAEEAKAVLNAPISEEELMEAEEADPNKSERDAESINDEANDTRNNEA